MHCCVQSVRILHDLSSTFFFFDDTATSEIYTLSLHDALPISQRLPHRHLERRAAQLHRQRRCVAAPRQHLGAAGGAARDRKSTRLNSSHVEISYAVFCLKKKKK